MHRFGETCSINKIKCSRPHIVSKKLENYGGLGGGYSGEKQLYKDEKQ